MLRTRLHRLAVTLTVAATVAATAPSLLPTPATAATSPDSVASLTSRGPVTVEAGQSATVAVVARDANGQFVAGVTPRATVATGPNAGATTSCTASEFDGSSLCFYSTSAVSGTDSVHVWVNQSGGGAPATLGRDPSEPFVAIQVTTIEPSAAGTGNARFVALTPSSAQVLQGTQQTMSALVTTADGSPVAGIVVTFWSYGAGSFSDGSEQLASRTNADGVATAAAIFAPNDEGPQTVVATIPGYSTECDETTTPAGVCAGNATLWSVSPSASPSPSPSASAPSNQPVSSLTVLPGDSSALVTWQPPTGDITPTSYVVWYGDPTGGAWTHVELPDTSLNYLIEGLSNGTEYAVEVHALYAVGDSAADYRFFTPAVSESPLPLAFATAPYDATDPATATTGTGSPTTESPVLTTVQVPAGATGSSIVIQQTSTSADPAPAGYTFFGQQIDITAPVASADSPLVLTFQVDTSKVPAGTNLATVTLVRSADGPTVTVPNCADSSGAATPDPCIASRAINGDGDITLTVLTSHASRWNTALAAPVNTGAVPQPVAAQPSASPSTTPSPAAPAPARAPLTLTVGTPQINAGTPAQLFAAGEPGASWALECYSRPATSYRPIRTGTFGSIPVALTLSPYGNTRCFLRYSETYDGASPSVVISVRPVLTLTAIRTGPRAFVFAGHDLPGVAGRVLTLYRVDAAGHEVRVATVVSDGTGTYRVRRTFLGTGALQLRVRSGSTYTHAAAVSNTVGVTLR